MGKKFLTFSVLGAMLLFTSAAFAKGFGGVPIPNPIPDRIPDRIPNPIPTPSKPPKAPPPIPAIPGIGKLQPPSLPVGLPTGPSLPTVPGLPNGLPTGPGLPTVPGLPSGQPGVPNPIPTEAWEQISNSAAQLQQAWLYLFNLSQQLVAQTAGPNLFGAVPSGSPFAGFASMAMPFVVLFVGFIIAAIMLRMSLRILKWSLFGR